MSYTRWGYEFDGTCTDPQELKAEAGVYVVWCESGETWEVLDVGESEDVRSTLANHERESRWREKCRGTIRFSATYTPGVSQEGRRRIEEHLRQAEAPLCRVDG